MSTADKLAKVLETKLNIKQAITEKGVSVLDTDTFASYPDKIRDIEGGTGGGSKLFVTNETGREFVKGDKVLVNFSGTEGTEYSGTLNLSQAWNKPLILTNNNIIYSNSYARKKIVTEWTPNGFISSTYTNITMHIDSRYPYVFQDNVLKQRTLNYYKCDIEDYNNMTFVTSEYWPLKDNLKLDLSSGILYNEDESLSYDTGIGSVSSETTIQIYDNTVIIHKTDSILFIDVSNFPECGTRTIPVPLTTTLPFGMTGIDEGSFLIFSHGNTFYFYQYTGTNFKPYLNIAIRDSQSCQYINIGEGIFCFIRTDNTPVVYMVEGESLIKKQIPIEIFNTIKGVATGSLYNNNICFVCNKDMTHFAWTYSTGQYEHYGVASHTGNGVKIYIVEPEQSNYTDAYSFTGIATGNVDDLGRYEVEMVLPETVDVKVVTNVNVANDEIIFEGME